MKTLEFNNRLGVRPEDLNKDAKMILEVNFPDGSDCLSETIAIVNITDLLQDKYRYDGMKLKSIKILTAIETYEEANVLSNFLRMHRYCFILPATHANNIVITDNDDTKLIH